MFRGNQNTHFLLNLKKNRAFYEIIWKNIVEPGRLLMTIRRIRIACWITRTIQVHSLKTRLPELENEIF